MSHWIIDLLKKTPLIKEECYVKHCHDRDIEEVTLLAFDPIDHDDTTAKLCEEHRAWAEGRNAFAEEMYDELREARKDIGMDHISEIQEWVVPQGKIREDVIDGSIKDDPDAPQHLTLEMALEGDT